MSEERSAKQVALASLAAALLAAVLLVVAVLPAEYGWDPLGTGAALGLLGLSGEQGTMVLVPQREGFRRDAPLRPGAGE